MTSEIEEVPCVMKLVERSYFTPPGWRLATIQEAQHNLEMIKRQEWHWDRARLLDGWISRERDHDSWISRERDHDSSSISSPRYNIQIGDDFRRFLGYMLVIQIQESTNSSSGNSGPTRSSIYADVTLTPTGREVALLLCVYDCNYEVVYWLLNCWENRETFNPLDVREGNIPLTNRTRFIEVNRMICHLCRILGEEGIAGQKAARRELSQDSVREVMVILANSCWNKFSQKHKNILPRQDFLNWIDEFISLTINKCSEVNWFQFASKRDTSAAIWNFLWHHISSCTLVKIVHKSLSFLMEELNNEERQEGSRRDFIMSTAILYYLLEYEEYMVKRILESECKDAGDRKRFKDALKNTSSAYYDKTGNYHVFNKILIYALQSMNGFVVNKVLEWGAQPEANLGPDNQSTALHYAILFHNGKEIVRSFFDKCHSKEELANAVDDQGMTALHLACQNADVSICEMVLEYGGRPDVRDNTGRLPLHYAVESKEKEIVRSLFDKCHLKEELANTADKEGMTALHLACRNADVSICEMVLEYGGRPDVRDNTGRLPLHYAVESKEKEIVRSLFDKCHLKEELANTADKEGMTALHLACQNVDVSICEMILEYGGRPDVRDNTGHLPLHYAVESKEKEIVRSLFDKCHLKEELANTVDKEGMTALHLACLNADVSICEMVLEYGGRPHVRDNTGRLPLHYAVERNLKEIVRSLFDKCHSKEELANATDDKGKTALHLACQKADVSICEMVLEYGGRPNVRDNTGRLPLHYAVESKEKEIVRSLFDKCHSKEELANAADNEGMTALHLLAKCYDADVSICEMVLEEGGKPDIPDKRGRLPVHYAIELGNEGIADVLIGRGNNDTVQSQDVSKVNPKMVEMVTRKDNDGVSPLDIAVEENNRNLMMKLLLVSQQPLASHFDKGNFDQFLREFALEGNLEVAEKLLQEGADPRARDWLGKTALHYASMCEDEDKALNLTRLMLDKCTSEEEKKKWVEEKDDEDHQTVLHVAAMKGNVGLCDIFCEINNDILHIKDADGRGLLYEVVERSPHDNPAVIKNLLLWYKYRRSLGSFYSPQRDIKVQFRIDHGHVTLLHVAASVGKTFTADALSKMSWKPKVYLRTADILGQTALHKAAKGGHADTVTVLLHHGAHPLLERDTDGRTALHCAVQNEAVDEDQAKAVAELLLKKCGSDEKKLLLLWASAAGLGTADQRLSDSSPLKKFLLQQKKDITEKLRKEGKRNNLLRTAACLGDIAMTKELITRGAQIGDIRDQNWMNSLNLKERHNVETVCKQIQIIAEQGNDQPAISDNLGRSDFAYGLAALLLNPYLKPPITVGISGSWGMGKSSLMVQTEGILLKTAAQLALLPSEMTSSDFPGIQILDLSEKGEKKYQEIKTTVDLLHNHKNLEKNLFLALKDKIGKWWMNVTNKKKSTSAKKGDSFRKFLNQYQAEYHHVFKSLAAMDSSYMFRPKDQQSQSEIDSPTEGSVPAILTVRYNAWKYRNESEALAGMAVEITKEMEGIMTDAQWFSTCLRNTWRKQKQVIWIEIIFPCLLAVLLAISFTWIVWLLLDRYKMKESKELKYASFPLTVVIMVWTLVKKVMSTVNPVSVQLMNYMKLPDHTEKLGYQERVISDITFLKEEISKKPYFLCTVALYIWHFITGSSIISLLSSKYRGESLASSIPSANLRTIVFVDDIDRCQESVILQVLLAINLVLAVCKISVVLGMDKALIQRAIMKKYGDKSLKNSRLLADKYLQKIIQLPLDLPDPTEVQSKIFLDRHLGVFQNQSKEGHSQSETYAEDDSAPEIDKAYNDLFPSFQISCFHFKPDFGKMLGSVIPIPEGSTSAQTREPVSGTRTADTEDIAINVQQANETNASNSQQTGLMQTLWQTVRKVAEGMQRINLFTTGRIQTNLETEAPQEANVAEGEQSLNDLIPLRQMLFMTYSKGEQNVFDYFQEMATDIRKLPREWKRLLNYHRLVWNIFLINNEAKDLYGWQVQLITWIFICWEWEENINILIENWDRLRALKNPKYSPPSLREIVDKFIADDKSQKKRDIAKAPENLEEDEEEEGVSTSTEDPESSNLEPSKLEVAEDQMIEVTEPQGDVSNEDAPKGRNELDALKKEIKEHVGSVTAEIKKQLAELKEQVDSIVNQRQVSWNEKSAKEKKLKPESWGRLKFALQKYDVSMEGIRFFQRFRFYCVAGYLPWPLPDKKIAEI